jgi:uncharacterized protein YaaQ
MKMIIAIIDDALSNDISQVLLGANYRVTQLATTGGFLRGGSTTLMVGVEDDRVEDALQIFRDRVPASQDLENFLVTLYVLNIKNFDRL